MLYKVRHATFVACPVPLRYVMWCHQLECRVTKIGEKDIAPDADTVEIIQGDIVR